MCASSVRFPNISSLPHSSRAVSPSSLSRAFPHPLAPHCLPPPPWPLSPLRRPPAFALPLAVAPPAPPMVSAIGFVGPGDFFTPRGCGRSGRRRRLSRHGYSSRPKGAGPFSCSAGKSPCFDRPPHESNRLPGRNARRTLPVLPLAPPGGATTSHGAGGRASGRKNEVLVSTIRQTTRYSHYPRGVVVLLLMAPRTLSSASKKVFWLVHGRISIAGPALHNGVVWRRRLHTDTYRRADSVKKYMNATLSRGEKPKYGRILVVDSESYFQTKNGAKCMTAVLTGRLSRQTAHSSVTVCLSLEVCPKQQNATRYL